MKRTSWTVVVALVASTFVAACQVSVDAADQRYACESPAECADGYECRFVAHAVRKECVRAGSVGDADVSDDIGEFDAADTAVDTASPDARLDTGPLDAGDSSDARDARDAVGVDADADADGGKICLGGQSGGSAQPSGPCSNSNPDICIPPADQCKHIIFVSSETYHGGFYDDDANSSTVPVTGRAAANAKCIDLASKAGWTGGIWQAVLGGADLPGQLTTSQGAVFNAKGKKIGTAPTFWSTHDWPDIVNENGQSLSPREKVWTGLKKQKAKGGPTPGSNCRPLDQPKAVPWICPNPNENTLTQNCTGGSTATIDKGDGKWLAAGLFGLPLSCKSKAHIYCISSSQGLGEAGTGGQ